MNASESFRKKWEDRVNRASEYELDQWVSNGRAALFPAHAPAPTAADAEWLWARISKERKQDYSLISFMSKWDNFFIDATEKSIDDTLAQVKTIASSPWSHPSANMVWLWDRLLSEKAKFMRSEEV